MNDLLDPEDLLAKLARDENLTGDEVVAVIDALKSWGRVDKTREISLDDLFNYIVVCRKANLKQYHSVLAGFLNSKDPLTVSLVLEILCLDWEMSPEYLEHAVSISIGVSWDKEGDAREQALKILGEYLRAFKLNRLLENSTVKLRANEREVLNLLVSILDDNTNNPFVRKAAYVSIARGFGVEWEDLPGECVFIDFENISQQVDYSLLEKVRAIIAES